MINNLQKKQNNSKNFMSAKITASFWIGILSISTIGIFGIFGYVLDQYFNSTPIAMITLVVLSFPIAQIIIYKKVKKELLN